jgi:hypothetical protein
MIMKKILIATNVLLFGIILFMACNNKKYEKKYDQPNCSKFCIDPPTVPLTGIINGDLLQTLSEDYESDKGKSMINYNSATGDNSGKDALSLTFDLDKIKNFIWQMEHSICVAGCNPKPELGIRFYYIKYPKGLDTTNVPKDLAGIFASNANKHALAMVPVYKAADKEWYDFDFRGNENGCPVDKKNSSNGKYTTGMISLGEGDNHGGIGPPPGRGTFPTLEQ